MLKVTERPWLKPSIWPKRVPKSLGYPEKPLFDILERAAEKAPDKTAIIFMGKKITFKELNESSDRFANALANLGIRKGDRVALLLPNCPQFVISYYGALKVGAIVVALNPLHTERELEYELNDSGAETIVTLNLKLTYPKVESLKEKTKLKRIIVTSIKEYLPFPTKHLYNLAFRKEIIKVKRGNGVLLFKELLKYPPSPPRVKIDPKRDLACIQYTGGTTALPKGALLTHFSMLANVYQSQAFASQYFPEEKFVPLSDEYREFLPAEKLDQFLFPIGGLRGIIGVLPIFHIYGMTIIMNTAIASASPMILFPRADLGRILKAIDKYKPDTFPSITTLQASLMEHPRIKKHDLSSIRITVLAAMAVPPKIVEDWGKLTGGYSVEGYGLTEASPATHVCPAHVKKTGSFGIPLPDTDAKVVDPETGEDLPPGKEGELLIRGPQVMKGYWNKPEETRKALKKGWLHTGDIVRMDGDGFFYFVERAKDLIKYKGYSVFPQEIEEVLYGHPAVALCTVVGKPDRVAGEIPKAYVVLKAEYKGKIKEEELIEFCKERVAPYKRIREVEFRDDLPKSIIGKVLRRKLREEKGTS